MGGIRSIGHRVSGAFPAWAKPSRVAAVTGVVTGVAELVITPLPNGDSWMRRLLTGYATYQATGNPVDILAEDSDGNNAATIAVYQLKQNAAPAIGTMVGFGIGAAILKWVGM